jgi:hypothetical protein
MRRKEAWVSATAYCATHRDAEAEASCVRCGDFVCRLCTPLEPVPLCARCAVRATVDWEERGELGVLRAFLRTLRVALGAPITLGTRLGGAGHLVHALQFTALCALSGLLPLALTAAVPLLTWADPPRHGLRSTGLLGAAVSLVPGSLVLATLAALGVPLISAVFWLSARALRVSIRYDVLTRAAAYGLSFLALPLLGPLLLPIGLFWSGLTLYGALYARAGTIRALGSLGLGLVGLLAASLGGLSLWW